MNVSDTGELLPETPETEVLSEKEQSGQPVGAEVQTDSISSDMATAATAAAEQRKPVLDDPKAAADVAKPLALRWIDSAISMLNTSIHSLDPDAAVDHRARIAIDIVRRHFHTDDRQQPISEAQAIRMIERNFHSMRGFLTCSDSIFRSVDDETAAKHTRGAFGTSLTVAAFAFTMKSISFTSQFPSLGPNCKASVVVHQLAHYIDARMKDHCGESEHLYYGLDFETALFNVRSYPNFAINATPPYRDERYGMARPNL